MNKMNVKSQKPQTIPYPTDIHNVLQNRELFGHHNWSRDRYPRYWGESSVKLGGLETFVNRLEQSKLLKCHNGCVNTVRWNDNGTKIVSGSDDTYLGIWRINFQYQGESKLISRFESGHDSNIFHAIFIPNTNDNEIISAALDCDVRYNIIDKKLSKRIGTHDGATHKLDIISQNVFLSCSEDGTIKLIDMRDKSTINPTRATNNCNNTIVNLVKFSHSTLNTESVSTLPKMTKERVSCYTMTLNPLDNNILAVGCRDKWLRLFDRRTLSLGHGKRAKPYRLLTQHSLLHKKSSSRYMDSEGITGIAWSYDGQELVASYSAGNIALFNLYADRSCRDFTDCKSIIKQHQHSESTYRELLSRFPNANDTSSEDEDDDDDDDDDDDNDEEQEQEQDTEMDDDDDNKTEESNNNDMDQDVVEFLADEEEREETEEQDNRVKKAVSKAKKLMTDINNKSDKFKEKIKKRLPHNLFTKKSSMSSWSYQYERGYIPYSLQCKEYKGHRTVETVKECNFFGPQSEYIISGSDCSNAFIWSKRDGKIINILKGDSRITNVVQGNPVNCSLVTSGLDKTVKLFTPTAETKHNNEDKIDEWNDIISTNQRDSENASRPIPMSLLVYLLRRGLYGFDISDDDDDDHKDDDPNENAQQNVDVDNDDDDDDDDEDEDEDVLQFLQQDDK